ncbi:MAG: hypothetical protein JW733_04750 [Coriobacteriia bacterium]|nr:hypothetical protein [Coriobacteriia bacterium]MBN2847426.1 hypothetical protein [Coriobacteriia bacterium]
MRGFGALRHEIVRLMTRRRFVLAGLVMLLAGISSMAVRHDGLVSAPGIGGFIRNSGSMLWLTEIDGAGTFFLAWPLVIGGTLAEDLDSGLASLLITRAGSRWRWFGAKLGAAYVSSTLLLLLLAVVWLAVAVFLAPWDPTNAGAVVPWGKELASSAPLALGFAVVLVLGLAAAATSATSMLLAALGAGRTVSQVGASVAYLAFMFMLPGAVNPGERARMLSSFAEWATPATTVGYWVAVLGMTAAATYALLRVRENR